MYVKAINLYHLVSQIYLSVFVRPIVQNKVHFFLYLEPDFPHFLLFAEETILFKDCGEVESIHVCGLCAS